MSGQINSSIQANVRNWSQVQYVREPGPGPICQGDDRKIKRPDWQKSCTTLLAVRSERSERSRSKPTRDEISWSKDKTLVDGNIFHHLCQISCDQNLAYIPPCEHLTRKSSVAMLAWYLYGGIIGNWWLHVIIDFVTFKAPSWPKLTKMGKKYDASFRTTSNHPIIQSSKPEAEQILVSRWKVLLCGFVYLWQRHCSHLLWERK